MKNAMKNHKFLFLLTILLVGLSAYLPAQAQLQEVSDIDLGRQTGQGLLDFTTIVPGSNGAASAPSVDNGLTFYRMGLNAQLDMNSNINHLQLGCGGVNNALNPNVCDVDIDYLSFLGNNGAGGAGSAGSDFTLYRPYITLAVANAGKANQSVAGIQIGSQSANGYLSMGRVYQNGDTNLEHSGACNSSSNPNDLNCHSGLNSFSGYTNLTLNGSVGGAITGWPCGPNWWDFLGNCSYHSSINKTVQVAGTRMTNTVINLNNLPTTATAGLTISLSVNAKLTENMRYIHGFNLQGVPDFFLSFQRQQVAWPNYDYSSSTSDPSGSAYAYAANTGWWMNLPSNISINGITGTQDISLGQAIGGILGITVQMSNVAMGQQPAKNCFGSATFC